MRWLLLGVLMLQVATCGQKGPLTLPEPTRPTEPEGAVLTTGATTR